MAFRLLILLSLAATAPSVSAFAPSNSRQRTSTNTEINMLMNPVVANLVAGSVAGAIGCGLAHPLDTLKTKAQIASSKKTSNQIAPYQAFNIMTPNTLLGTEVALPLINTFDLSYSMVNAAEKRPNMLQVATALYQQEGLQGFFAGVQTMMLGQALIRAVCFTTNAAVSEYLQRFGALDASSIMLIAAFSAGVTSSLVVTPVERIKVMMQSNPDVYSNEIQCIQAVLDTEGIGGLLTRGLGISLIREIPSVGLSFILYALLMQQSLTFGSTSIAPLLFGAISGSLSCVPVYPVDCVKTRVQNTVGGDMDKNSITSPLEIAQDLYDNRGVSGFVDGLTPKMLRCAVLYAVSFSVYEHILSLLLYTPPAVEAIV
jgi:solute carrier family 25 carnitine/acylcarnitine transporter 20/29